MFIAPARNNEPRSGGATCVEHSAPTELRGLKNVAWLKTFRPYGAGCAINFQPSDNAQR